MASSSSSTPVKQHRKGKQFMWVNKDPASSQLSRSDGNEASSILKFVQRNREPNRRRRPSSKPAHDFVAFETEGQICGSTPTDQHPKNPDLALPEDMTLWDAVRSMSNRWRLNVPVNNFTPGDTVDPFSAAVVPITEPIFAILQYCKANVTAGASGYRLALFPEEIRPMTDVYQSALAYLFRHVVEFKHIMYPVLAAYSRLMQVLSEHSLRKTQNPDWYLHMALHAVRVSLADKADDREIPIHIATGVHFLICSAGLGGHYEESQTHIRAFLKLLPHMDTKSPVGFWELDTVSSLDIMMASASGLAPIIKIATSDPGSLSPTRMTQFREKLKAMQREERSAIMNAVGVLSASFRGHQLQASHPKYDLLQNPTEDFDLSLGSSLQMLVTMPILLAPIAAVLRQILDCLTVAKVVWREPEFVSKHDTKWLCQKSRTVLHELLCLVGPKAFDVSSNEGRISEALRLTLLMIMITVQYRSVARLARNRYSGPLREILSPILESDWNGLHWSLPERNLRRQSLGFGQDERQEAGMDLNELLLWMLLTAHWITSGSPDEGWFAQKAAEVALQRLGLSSSDLENVMRKFLYSRTVQRPCIDKVAELIPF